jgi:hypothetical protein
MPRAHPRGNRIPSRDAVLGIIFRRVNPASPGPELARAIASPAAMPFFASFAGGRRSAVGGRRSAVGGRPSAIGGWPLGGRAEPYPVARPRHAGAPIYAKNGIASRRVNSAASTRLRSKGVNSARQTRDVANRARQTRWSGTTTPTAGAVIPQPDRNPDGPRSAPIGDPRRAYARRPPENPFGVPAPQNPATPTRPQLPTVVPRTPR